MKYLIPALPLLIGFALDAVFGDPYSMPHPIRLIGNLIAFLEKYYPEAFSKFNTWRRNPGGNCDIMLGRNSGNSAEDLLSYQSDSGNSGRKCYLLLYACSSLSA